MAHEAIFLTISPFLEIDDNTTKASKINAKNNTKCKNWWVRINLACLDGLFNAQLHLPPAWSNWYFRLYIHIRDLSANWALRLVLLVHGIIGLAILPHIRTKYLPLSPCLLIFTSSSYCQWSSCFSPLVFDLYSPLRYVILAWDLSSKCDMQCFLGLLSHIWCASCLHGISLPLCHLAPKRPKHNH